MQYKMNVVHFGLLSKKNSITFSDCVLNNTHGSFRKQLVPVGIEKGSELSTETSN